MSVMKQNEFAKDFYSEIHSDLQVFTVKEAKKLNCTWKEVYHIKFNEKIHFNYEAGDSLGLIAENSAENINGFMKICGWEDQEIVFNRKISSYCQKTVKYQGKLSYFLKIVDLTCISSREFYQKVISEPLSNELYRKILHYSDFPRFIKEFNIKIIPVKLFLEHCNFIAPRNYTVINKKDEFAEILVGILYSNTKIGHFSEYVKNEEYLKSNLLGFIKSNKKVSGLKKGSDFICICTGTGIAPFIAFRHEYPDLKLVYGYRNEEDNLADYFGIKNSVTLYKSSNKKYVTDFIKNLRETDRVFACGSLKMRKAVLIKLKEQKPKILQSKRFFYDSWI
ncbi:hypothetical protein NUSPORA_02257 [Nucleospora cyclopteri]